jgi:hypothetical protein
MYTSIIFGPYIASLSTGKVPLKAAQAHHREPYFLYQPSLYRSKNEVLKGFLFMFPNSALVALCVNSFDIESHFALTKLMRSKTMCLSQHCMIKILDILVNYNDILTPKTIMYLKKKGRLKTCHWVPIGAMGPACIDSTVPPHSSGGMRVLSILFQ